MKGDDYMQKGSTKTVGILFVIILVVLLIAHLVTLRNVRTEFSGKEEAMKAQITELNGKVDALTMKNKGLNVKLALRGIAIDIVRNDFGDAKDQVSEFKQMLKDGGCTKMEALEPLFEEMNTSLLKTDESGALKTLEAIETMIFQKEEPVAEEAETEGEATE